MSVHHEARINDALKQLGEEFRLGMVQAAEYRARRKALIESWGERDATTSPGSLRAKTATTATNLPRMGGPAAGPRRPPLVAVIVVVAIVVLAGIAYTLMKPATPPGAGPATPAVPLSPQVQAVSKAADEFLAAKSWEAEPIERFLAAWRQLPAADRAVANEQPSMRTLRYQLDQNIQSESQLVAPDAPPEERQRLSLLEGFARELAGESP
jgi:hypothetical protein